MQSNRTLYKMKGNLFRTFYISLFLICSLAALSRPANAIVTDPPTSCGDGLTTKIGGRVWIDIKRDNNEGDINFVNSTGKRDVSMKMIRGDGKSITFKTGYEYKYDNATNSLTQVRALSGVKQDLGFYYVCGFITDRAVGGSSDKKTLFSVQVASIPNGYISGTTVRPPQYQLSFKNNIILGTMDVYGADTLEGEVGYVNQIGGQGFDGASASCNSRKELDPGTNLRPSMRCDFFLTPEPQKTLFTGRVSADGAYWQTGTNCSGYETKPSLSIKSERYDSSGAIVATGTLAVNQCNPQPYYSSGAVIPAKRRLTLTGIPSGYQCSDWTYSKYNLITRSWNDVRSSSGAVFDKNTCSLTLNIPQSDLPFDNSHHIWFMVKKITAPTPTRSITPTSTPMPPTPTPIACNIVPTDIQLVIDRSSSMWDNSATNSQGVTKTKLEWAKVAANKFVDEFANTGAASRGIVRIGLTSFMGTLSGTTSTSYKPTSNFDQVRSWINAIPANSSGSCISCGESAAQTSLTAAGLNGTKVTRKVVVMLSDGRANHMINNRDLNSDGSINSTDAGYEAINLANASRSSMNYLYYVVGFGSSSSPVRAWVLQGDRSTSSSYPDTGIANEPPSTYYRYGEAAFDWSTLFDRTQDNICLNPALRAQ